MAYPMMWVKLTFAPVVRANWLFRTRRLTSSSRAGTVRTLVAVGTERLASMLATIREAAPRSGVASSRPTSPRGVGAGAVGAGAAGPVGASLATVAAVVACGWGAGTGAGR